MTEADREKDRMFQELKAAADVRDRYKQHLAEAEGRVPELRAKLRATPQAKALAAAKRAVKKGERDHQKACESHDQVEAEYLTGMTGLDLFDAPKKTIPAKAEAVAS